MGIFYLKENDTEPILEVDLFNPDETPHDLTVGEPTVRVHIFLVDKTIFTREMLVLLNPINRVQYRWTATDWDQPGGLFISGAHLMEYEARRGATARVTFPNGDEEFDTLYITRDIADG